MQKEAQIDQMVRDGSPARRDRRGARLARDGGAHRPHGGGHQRQPQPARRRAAEPPARGAGLGGARWVARRRRSPRRRWQTSCSPLWDSAASARSSRAAGSGRRRCSSLWRLVAPDARYLGVRTVAVPTLPRSTEAARWNAHACSSDEWLLVARQRSWCGSPLAARVPASPIVVPTATCRTQMATARDHHGVRAGHPTRRPNHRGRSSKVKVATRLTRTAQRRSGTHDRAIEAMTCHASWIAKRQDHQFAWTNRARTADSSTHARCQETAWLREHRRWSPHPEASEPYGDSTRPLYSAAINAARTCRPVRGNELSSWARSVGLLAGGRAPARLVTQPEQRGKGPRHGCRDHPVGAVRRPGRAGLLR